MEKVAAEKRYLNQNPEHRECHIWTVRCHSLRSPARFLCQHSRVCWYRCWCKHWMCTSLSMLLLVKCVYIQFHVSHMSFVILQIRTHFNFHILEWYTGDLDRLNGWLHPVYYFHIIRVYFISSPLFTAHTHTTPTMMMAFSMFSRVSIHFHELHNFHSPFRTAVYGDFTCLLKCAPIHNRHCMLARFELLGQ